MLILPPSFVCILTLLLCQKELGRKVFAPKGNAVKDFCQ